MTIDRVGGTALALLALFTLEETYRLRLPLRSLQSLETPIVFKQGEEFQKFFDADAHRLAEGVRRVGKIETK